MSPKVRHVLAAKQNRYHTCHWPGCGKQVPPAKWGCREHWYSLPVHIRHAIWHAYEIGQEDHPEQVTRIYAQAARNAQDWIERHGAL